jgi:hypothetical protein
LTVVRGYVLERVKDLPGERATRGHDRRARDGCLGDTRGAECLRGSPATAAGQEADPLLDPHRKLANTADMSTGQRWRR